MISYSSEEVFPATQVSRKFGEIIKKLKDRTIKRVAVSKNNTIEAVILPAKEYERIQEIMEWHEMKEIFEIIENRKDSQQSYSLEEVLKENGINYNEI